MTKLGWHVGEALKEGGLKTPLPGDALHAKTRRTAIISKDRGDDGEAQERTLRAAEDRDVAPPTCAKCEHARWPAYLQKGRWDKKSGNWKPPGWVCKECAETIPTCTLCAATTWYLDNNLYTTFFKFDKTRSVNEHISALCPISRQTNINRL